MKTCKCGNESNLQMIEMKTGNVLCFDCKHVITKPKGRSKVLSGHVKLLNEAEKAGGNR